MSVREKVAAAIESAIHDTPNPFTPYTTVADAAIAAHLDALKTDGYAVVHTACCHLPPGAGLDEMCDCPGFEQPADHTEEYELKSGSPVPPLSADGHIGHRLHAGGQAVKRPPNA